MRLTRIAVVSAFTLAALAPRNALAYCRTSTQGFADGCTITNGECCTVGLPIYWAEECTALRIIEGKKVGLADAQRVFKSALATWTGANCAATGATDGPGSPSLAAYVLGRSSAKDIGYEKNGGPNENSIIFRDDEWPHSDAFSTLMLTTTTFVPETGQILDADLEVNTADFAFSVANEVPNDGYDLLACATHEIGHYLGLAHAPDQNATMFGHYEPGTSTQRALSTDDVHGICDVYRPDGSRGTASGSVPAAACNLIQGSQCETTVRSSCTLGSPTSNTSGIGLALLTLLGIVRRRSLRARVCCIQSERA